MRRPIAKLVCWVGAIGLIALAVDVGYAYLEVREARHRLTLEMEERATALSQNLGDKIAAKHVKASPGTVKRLLARLGWPGDRVKVFDRRPATVAVTPEVALPLSPVSAHQLDEAMAGAPSRRLISFNGTPVFVHARPLPSPEGPDGKLLVFLDASPLKQLEHAIWTSHAVRFLTRVVLVCLAVLVVARISRNDPPMRGAYRFSALASGMWRAVGARSR